MHQRSGPLTLLRSLLLSKVTSPSSDSSRSLAALRTFLAMLPVLSADIKIGEDQVEQGTALYTEEAQSMSWLNCNKLA